MNINLGSLKAFFNIEERIPHDVVVGIDFGASTLKIVQVSKKQDIPTLDTYGGAALGPYLGQPEGAPVVLDHSAFVSALRDVARSAGVTARGAAISLPVGASFTVILTVPSLIDEEIQAQVPVLIRERIPVQLQDVTIDWFPLARNESTGETTIIAVAVYNKTLKQLRNVVTQAGFAVLYTELEYFSALRTLTDLQSLAHIIIDMGASNGKVYSVVGGKLVNVQSVSSFGGARITEMVRRSQNIEQSDAELIKQEKGTEGIPELSIVLDAGVREMTQMISASGYSEALRNAPVTLIGGGARMPGIEAYLRGKLAREVAKGEPIHMVAYPMFLKDILADIGGIYGIATATALAAVLMKD